MKPIRTAAIAASLAMASCGPTVSCVARGARVRTPGGLQRIEELAVGDEVSCFDPDSGEWAAGRLSAIQSARRETHRLSFEGGELTVTSDHPLFCPRTRAWAPAGDWVLGKRTTLLHAAPGEPARIVVVEAASFAGVAEVFDLTVDHPLHTFVAEGVLVHNKSQPLRQCRGADGVFVMEFDACRCGGCGSGRVHCDSPTAPTCGECSDPCADGGTPDGGRPDGG